MLLNQVISRAAVSAWIRAVILGSAVHLAGAQASSIALFVQQGGDLGANLQIVNPTSAQDLSFDQAFGTISTTQPYGFDHIFLDVAPGLQRFDYSAAGGNPESGLFAGGGVGGQFGVDSIDSIFLTGGPASGALRLQARIDGSISLTASPNLSPGQPQEADSKLFLDFLVSNNRVLTVRDDETNGVLNDDFSEIVTFLIPFSGSVVGINESLSANYACGGGRLESCLASASFDHTFQLGGAVVLDNNGNVVSGVSLTSQTGYDYSQTLQLNSTPEPATCLLMVGPAGLFLLVRHSKIVRV